ncbi:tryptophan--tRNA ligase [Rhizomonospora bruguierae]|uniref:tryptophan--tRNA ligase n=1 Tax=Rhizomonospora bruguierae TaxID=1581705 RepID=UPI001BD13C71|nr:tryptophan--tRNA ligase [Micromonospora sp. NBRC 107566]
MSTTLTRTRRLTGFKPTGHFTLGNLLGAIRPIVAPQYGSECVAFLADLHAMTKEHDPAALRALTLEQATVLLAAGVDPDRTLLYVQSQLPQHTELHYLLECATGYGEAQRMIQFKEESTRQAQVRLSLLTYPVLMAADVLLHDTDEVPVGDDQTQHMELTRGIATRFNHRYGPTFTVPRVVNPEVAARVMDLSDPRAKMGKSTGSVAGTLFVLDPPAAVRRKVSRAVTDGESRVRHDPERKPGVSNLLEILAACTDRPLADLAGEFDSYGRLKAAVTEAVVALTHPIQVRYAELSRDPGYVRRVLEEGAERARERAEQTVFRARRAMGLL